MLSHIQISEMLKCEEKKVLEAIKFGTNMLVTYMQAHLERHLILTALKGS